MTTQFTDINQLIDDGGVLRTSWLTIDDCSLVVVEGPHTGLEFRLTQEITRIGRSEWCDLQLSDDQGVSNFHCECWLEERGVRIRDLNSKNGTILNDCPVIDAYVVKGARIRLGDSILQLKSHQKRREIAISYQDESGLLVGQSPSMRKLFSMLPRLGERDVTILLTGETGTGKTTVAEAIHKQSRRSHRPFVVVNCGALAGSLIESLLFGHEKGAFTGADTKHQGFFQQAHGGTLFLDEIAELPLELQPKLLAVLENKKVRPLGSGQEIDVDIRLIVATHQDLNRKVEEKQFREDLFFRLSVIELEVPALRERREDIPLLAEKLLQSRASEQRLIFTEQAIQKLQSHLWPGNIRELRNVLDRTVTFLEGNLIDAKDVALSTIKEPSEVSNESMRIVNAQVEQGAAKDALQPSSSVDGERTNNTDAAQPTHREAPHSRLSLPSTPIPDTSAIHCEVISVEDVSVQLTKPLQELSVDLKELMSSFEKAILSKALDETNKNAQQASEILGISLAWLYNRINKYELKPRRNKETKEK